MESVKPYTCFTHDIWLALLKEYQKNAVKHGFKMDVKLRKTKKKGEKKVGGGRNIWI
jgi:hypothetical protein